MSLPLDQNALAEIRQNADLLHLLVHRNRNQHRHAPWWSSLTLLRRHVRGIVEERDEFDDVFSRAGLDEKMKRANVGVGKGESGSGKGRKTGAGKSVPVGDLMRRKMELASRIDARVRMLRVWVLRRAWW